MKLYNSIGPNPRAVKMFMAEKGITIPFEEVDIMGAANRQADYLKINPAGQLPALELDNGHVVTEITVICEYLEDIHPTPPLIGTTPEEKAETRMWTRRIDLNYSEPMANGFRYAEGLPMFKDRFRCLPEAADGMKAIAKDKLAWLNGLMDGKTYVCGDRLTYADIHFFASLDFAHMVGQPLDPANTNIAAWYERMKALPSAQATA